MSSQPRFTNAPLKATPSLERLLMGLGSRLRILISLRAIGLTVATLAAAWAWAFFADFVLNVPAPIRALDGLIIIAAPCIVFWRTGLRHLVKQPTRRDLAILLEERQPSGDLFTSATDFQLTSEPAPEVSATLIHRVFAKAESSAANLNTKNLGVLDPVPTRKASAWGLAAAAVLIAASTTWPAHQGIFASRLFGAGEAWPQLTFLSIEIPLDSGITRTENTIEVRIARGEDLPVTVLAQGQAPTTVQLLFDSGSARSIPAAPSRADQAVFATTLRSVSRDMSFVVEGGDDSLHTTRVVVKALSPPDLSQLVATITPPAYTGLAVQTLADSDLSVLAGSQIKFLAKTEPADVSGLVRLLPEDRTIELSPSPDGLSFSLSPERSLRMRFELLDDEGLGNPDPGLWSVRVFDDRAPRVSVRSPEGHNLETTTDGVLPLWVAISDDFAVASAQVIGGREDAPINLELRSTDDTDGARFAFAAIPLERLSATPEVGQTIWLEVEALDNRTPTAQAGRSSKLSLRILSREDYMRRVQDRLAGVRRRVSELFDLQRDKRLRLQELSDAFAIDGDLDQGGHGDLAVILSGQRRITADSASILRELAGLTGDVLHARVDTEATGQLDQLDRYLASRDNAEFDPAMWRQLVEKHNAGQLGKSAFAGNLIELTGAGLQVSMDTAPAALAAVQLAAQTELTTATLDAAQASASKNLAQIESLLSQLAEWDNFQSVLALTREVLERQRAVHERTKELATQ